MLTAKLTDDNNWILVDGNPDELGVIRKEFTKKIDSWFIIKAKHPEANVEECFMNYLGAIPVGLWLELVRVCKTYGYLLTFTDGFNEKIRDTNMTKENFVAYMDKLFAKSIKIKPRDYQIDGVYNTLLYRKCCIEVSTSGGKTLMAYMMFRYMIDVLNLRHILFVTPKTELTTQSSDKFLLYDLENQIMTQWSFGEIHTKAKKRQSYDDCNIVFGNYQSLAKKKDLSFFEGFEAVIIDECHHSSAKSLRNILKKCAGAKYKIGMTGTFPSSDKDAEAHNSFTLQSYIGPIVYRLSSHELINEKKSATPVYVTTFILKYLEEAKLGALFTLRSVNKKSDPTIGNKLLFKEREIVWDNYKRFKYICNMVTNAKHNCLIIFSDTENGYGRKYFNYLKETTDKRCFYIDGNTAPGTRSQMKEAMENDAEGKTVMVASMGCFSEGIDIANVWNIFLVETTKSDHTLAQILGRGMRKYEGKDRTMVLDFVDDFRYGNGNYVDNYLFKHGLARMEIYKTRGFPCSVFEIDLTKDK